MNTYNLFPSSLPDLSLVHPVNIQDILSTLHLNTLLANYVNSSLGFSSDNINQKRFNLSDSDADVDECELPKKTGYKKFKSDANSYNKNMMGSQIIPCDNDGDCFIIDNPLAVKDQQLEFSDLKYPNALNAQINHLGLPNLLEQNLKLWESFNSLNFEPLKLHFEDNTLKCPKQTNVIVIDEDDDNDSTSTCQTTPQFEQDYLKQAITIPSNQNHDEGQRTETGNTSEITVNKETNCSKILSMKSQHAFIQPFQLNKSSQKNSKSRSVKLVWKPKDDFENWLAQIEKAVGMQISDQEKVLKTMKSFDMKIETALDAIKRNKAFYKNYFRVHKIARNPKIY